MNIINKLMFLKESILNEDRVSFVIDRVSSNKKSLFFNSTDSKSDISLKLNKLINLVKEIDPTDKKEYFQWIMKIIDEEWREFLDNNSHEKEEILKDEFVDLLLNQYNEDSKKYRNTLELFSNNKPLIKKEGHSIDINKYNSFDEVFKIVSIYIDKEDLLGNKKFIKTKQVEIVHEDSNYIVLIPKTFEASQFYSTGTDWCTHYPDMYKHYSKQGNLYIILSKKNPERERFQLHFESRQFMNIYDMHISEDELSDIEYIVNKLVDHEVKNLSDEQILKSLVGPDGSIMLKGSSKFDLFDLRNWLTNFNNTETFKNLFVKVMDAVFLAPVKIQRNTMIIFDNLLKDSLSLINSYKVPNEVKELNFNSISLEIGNIDFNNVEKIDSTVIYYNSTNLANVSYIKKLVVEKYEDDLQLKEDVVIDYLDCRWIRRKESLILPKYCKIKLLKSSVRNPENFIKIPSTAKVEEIKIV